MRHEYGCSSPSARLGVIRIAPPMTQLYCSQMRKGSEDNSCMLEEIANKKWDLNSKGFARQPMMHLGYNLGRGRVGYYLKLGRPGSVFGD